ncbi:hypothetical protein NicSoilC12_37560 [Arthrobacter sp. NicSoilC12]|nr:hypothetical protein NicSoilC12_37560 [Arthrobacter sp. NicSoilC12]
MGPRDADSAASLPGVTGDMSALDLQSLWNIAEDTQGPALALQFLSDFFSLQQARVSRILATLAEEDPAGSANAVRSLHTASSMAGAKHIAERCAIILPLVGARNFTSARVHATALQCDVEALTAASPHAAGASGGPAWFHASCPRLECGEAAPWNGTESRTSIRPGCHARLASAGVPGQDSGDAC